MGYILKAKIMQVGYHQHGVALDNIPRTVDGARW